MILPLLLFLMSASSAQTQRIPNLQRQDLWGQEEKNAFLKHLKSNQIIPPSGQVKEIGPPPKETYAIRKARYITLAAASDSLFTVDEDGRIHDESTSVGPKLLLGGHLFSWIRFYTGVQYNRFKQRKFSGATAFIDHYQAPAGLELALIPLGTPHTRYIILRAGAAAHFFSSEDDKSEFRTPLLGRRGTWNLGLGYEWQIPNTGWRIHLAAEGYRAFNRKGSQRFLGGGGTLGVVRTF